MESTISMKSNELRVIIHSSKNKNKKKKKFIIHKSKQMKKFQQWKKSLSNQLCDVVDNARQP